MKVNFKNYENSTLISAKKKWLKLANKALEKELESPFNVAMDNAEAAAEEMIRRGLA